jgi:hypothetical protein
MPTASGQLQLNDYDQELIDQGFDGISQSRRFRWINFAYQRIAAKFPWLWEKTSVDAVINPGEYFLDFTVDLPNFRSLDFLYVVTAGQNRRLRPVDDDQFYDTWLSLDLTAAANRGEPAWYKIEDNELYILPPPQAARTIRAKYHRRITILSNTVPGTTDTPITPQYLDEAILIAALSVAHKRTHELQLAAQAEVDLGDWVDQMKIDEEWQDVNDQERVSPDDSWL